MKKMLSLSSCGFGRQKGQSLVELALTLPFVAILLMGITDLGFVLYAHAQVAAATGEASLAGSRVLIDLGYPSAPVPPTGSQDRNNIDDYRFEVVKYTLHQNPSGSPPVGAMGMLNYSLPNFNVNDTQIEYYPNPAFPGPIDPPTQHSRTGTQMKVTVHYKQKILFNLLPGILPDSLIDISYSSFKRIQ